MTVDTFFECSAQHAMSGRDVFADMRSVGNYALDGVSLGKGTFSRVERATHLILKRHVALKIQGPDSMEKKISLSFSLQNGLSFGLTLSKKNHRNPHRRN